MTTRASLILASVTLAALLSIDVSTATAQTPVWSVPQSTTRAVLAQWTQAAGYGVIWSEGVPDFRTQQRDITASFPDAVRMLVSGYGSSITNLYCPPSTHYPATAYTVDARIDQQARLIFVYGIPTSQECRPMPG